MDYFVIIVLAISVLASIGSAAVLAYKGVTGWGWFLFLAFMMSTGFKIHLGQ